MTLHLVPLLDLAGTDAGELPVLVMDDGEVVVRPDLHEVAARIGLHVRAERDAYDLVIAGAGPAGLAAAVYGASEGLATLLLECSAPGGQAGTTSRIENYLGFPVGLSGADLTLRAREQATRFGAEMLVPSEAVGLVRADPYAVVTLGDGGEVSASALVIASGVTYRTLSVPGAAELTGRGVYYGAGRAEAADHAGGRVFVVGGGNSAGQAAVFLSAFAAEVTLLVRGADLTATMSRYLTDRIEASDRITVEPGTAASFRQCSTSVGTRTNGNRSDTSTSPVACMMRAAFSGEVVIRCRSLNHCHCSAEPSGTNSELKNWRNAGFSRPQPCRISDIMVSACSGSRLRRPRPNPP